MWTLLLFHLCGNFQRMIIRSFTELWKWWSWMVSVIYTEHSMNSSWVSSWQKSDLWPMEYKQMMSLKHLVFWTFAEIVPWQIFFFFERSPLDSDTCRTDVSLYLCRYLSPQQRSLQDNVIISHSNVRIIIYSLLWVYPLYQKKWCSEKVDDFWWRCWSD